MRDGLIERLEQAEILLYFFLVSVADRHGLSYWGDARTAGLLKLSLPQLAHARRSLIGRGLVAFEPPLYQVLDLEPQGHADRSGMASIQEVLRRLGAEKEHPRDA